MPRGVLLIDQLHEQGVDQIGGVEIVSVALLAQLTLKQSCQLKVDERQNLVERVAVAVAPLGEQAGDVGRGRAPLAHGRPAALTSAWNRGENGRAPAAARKASR